MRSIYETLSSKLEKNIKKKILSTCCHLESCMQDSNNSETLCQDCFHVWNQYKLIRSDKEWHQPDNVSAQNCFKTSNDLIMSSPGASWTEDNCSVKFNIFSQIYLVLCLNKIYINFLKYISSYFTDHQRYPKIITDLFVATGFVHWSVFFY